MEEAAHFDRFSELSIDQTPVSMLELRLEERIRSPKQVESLVAKSSKLEVRLSPIPGAGRGVFSKVPFKKGSVIEVCHASVLPLEDLNFEKDHLLHFTWFELPGIPEGVQIICWGFGSLYNHSDSPSATSSVVFDSPLDRLPSDARIIFRAKRAIWPGEEITWDYDYRGKSPAWYACRHR
jgi:hypothetical protein